MEDPAILRKQIEGQEKTIRRLISEKAELQKENHQLRRDLGARVSSSHLRTKSA